MALSGTNNSNPRCHPVSRLPVLLAEYQHTPGNLRMPSRHGILGSHTFDHALGGPFSNLHFDPALSFPDSLYAHLLLLSPLQRFERIFNFNHPITMLLENQHICENL